jgi:hypothetical protein
MDEGIRSSSEPNNLYRGAREALQRWVLAVQDLDPQSTSDLYAEEGMAF